MKFVVSAAFNDPDHLLELAACAEECGFEAMAFPDHVVHPEKLDTPYPYTADGSRRWAAFTPWVDPWVAIAACAAVTTRLRFTNNVFVLAMRNPFLAAKAIATAAALSRGRVTLTLGVGWSNIEYQLLGQDFRSRGRRNRLFAPEEAGENVGDDAAEAQVRMLAVQTAMASLPEEQRLAVALVLVEGLSYREAADVLEVPIGTLTSRLARGREALQRQLAGDS